MARQRRIEGGAAATSLAACEDGAAILEFVLVLPIMLVLLGGAFELGRILLVDAALEAGVRGGARYLARVADPFCNPGCSPGAAHAMSLARDRIFENTRLAPSRLRVETLADAGPGHVGLRAEADVSVDLLGWAGLSPTIRLSATHWESHVGE
ncbi:TadE/TadG family type IV pilus assembly protein [Methylobacterium sp. J-076]|uniref:TadE/TadG family type IV pilus assembly protein n=1 Tax=Methylobacterium sp. J-076 TaxID=2836655 RepID=UPI001FBBC943|nr:TadE family protein [Methylobacterium sp. J-076]MCJ2011933.1 pilus assembly protein [Methylobacterium sp. J-076]